MRKLCTVATLAAAAILAQADTVPAPSYASYFDRLPCVSRVGRCFDARIANLPVTVIETKAEQEQLVAQLPDTGARNDQVFWIVRAPVPGKNALDVFTEANALGIKHVGKEKEEPDVTVYPLDGQHLESTSEVSAESSVRINGQAVLTQQEVLAGSFLPPGRYLFAIKYLGETNWDRKWVYLVVQ